MTTLRNAARGEAVLHIEGKAHRLRLTLGALAELEAAFDAASIDALAARFAHLGADDLLVVLEALCAGGGNPMSRADLAASAIAPRAAAHAVAEAFRLAFADEV